ncbi:hypothetical protein, partial [uncultured Flavobacterium sp.]|uniref:hypothetical protein n=1 Tax=uncultured Flavobacterium sp. TaxID=165435 RepID=UPI0026006586
VLFMSMNLSIKNYFQKKNGKKESTKSSARLRIRSAISPEGRQGRYAHAGACGCYFRGSFNPFSLRISIYNFAAVFSVSVSDGLSLP